MLIIKRKFPSYDTSSLFLCPVIWPSIFFIGCHMKWNSCFFVAHMRLCPLLDSESTEKSTMINSPSFLHQSIRRKDDPQEVRVQIQFLTYGTRPSKDKSGAYLFLPDGNAKVASACLAW